MKSALYRDGFSTLILILLIVVLTGLGLTGWAVYQRHIRDQAAIPAPGRHGTKDELMILKYRGGLCAASDAAAKDCNAEHRLYMDGSFENHTELTVGELDKLQTVIKETDFLKYQPKLFPRCESYVDGLDEVLLFPQKYSDKNFVLCELNISSHDEAINYINNLIKTHERR